MKTHLCEVAFDEQEDSADRHAARQMIAMKDVQIGREPRAFADLLDW